MIHTRPIITALAFVVVSGCGLDGPTGPTSAGTAPQVAGPVSSPFTLRQGDIFQRVSPSTVGALSRYVFHDDSTFTLQYLRTDRGLLEYAGRYTRSDSTIRFSFADRSGAGAWVAKGTVQRDSLIVEYNDVMSLADFEDGAYVRPRTPFDQMEHVFVAAADGSRVTKLIPGRWPAWSPDGKQIAFYRSGGIYVIDADGLGERFVAEGAYPGWSPDGKRLVFDGDAGITVVNVDGSGAVTLIGDHFRTDTYRPWDMGVAKPAWSPDGKLIAFEHLGDGDMQPARIFVMNADGSNPRPLTKPVDGRIYAESDPAWSPDGSRLGFWSYGFGIATAAVTDGLPSTVYRAQSVVYGSKPSLSAGGLVAFTSRISFEAAPSIFVVPINAQRAASLLLADAEEPAWSPDGKRIAFIRVPR